jgi:hypothetical protein
LNLARRFDYAPGVAARFTIGELAKAAGVPTSTVRYYEPIRKPLQLEA